MLGWEGALAVMKNNSYGPGQGPIWIDGLKCLGNEDDLTKCQHDRWGITNCDHTEDLGIRCTHNLTQEEVRSVLTVYFRGISLFCLTQRRLCRHYECEFRVLNSRKFYGSKGIQTKLKTFHDLKCLNQFKGLLEQCPY